MEEFVRFLAVADIGNVSRAAQSLNLSQPTLSRTISMLEERYRTVLFHRGPTGMSLTEAGRILYDHASRALRVLRNAEERIDFEGMGGQLSLNICAGDSWGNVVLPGILQKFKSIHSDIRIRIEIVGSEARMAGLARGDYDLSYGISLPRHERTGKITFVPMLRAGYAVYSRADHPLRKRQGALTPKVLAEYQWIKHKFEFDHDPAQWQVTGRMYAMSTNTMLSTLELVRQSDYLISTSAISQQLFKQHEVHAVGPDPLSADHVSGLHHLTDASMTLHARRFMAFCKSECEKRFQNYRFDA